MGRCLCLLTTLLLPLATSLLVVQRPHQLAQPAAPRNRLVVLQDGEPAATSAGVPVESAMPEAAATPADATVDAALREKQIESVARAGDPFRYVRTVLYVIFGLVGLAGAGIAVSKGNMADAGVNSAFLLGAGVAFVVDQKIQGALTEKAKEEIENPYLKGEMLFADGKDKDQDQEM